MSKGKTPPTKEIMIFLIFILSMVFSSCQPKPVEDQIPTFTSTVTPIPSKTAQPTSSPTSTATVLPDWWINEDALSDTEITLVYPWSGELARRMEILVDTFNQTNDWGVFVTAYGLGSAQQVFQQSEAGIQNGDGPQVVMASNEELAYWSQLGDLKPLDSFITDTTYGLDQEFVSDFLPLFWEQDNLNGLQLGIPVARGAQFLLYNSEWAKSMGFQKPPQTPAQFRIQTCAARDAQLQNQDIQFHGTGGYIITNQDYPIISWIKAFGAEEFPLKEEPYLFDQTATLETFLFLRQLSDDTCAWRSRNPTPYDYFSNRQALLVSANIQDLVALDSNMKLNEATDEWTVLPYPGLDQKPVLMTYGSSLGIIRSTKEQELASWLLIRWLSEPLQQKQLAKVNPNLPVTRSLLKELSAERLPQWAAVVDLLDIAQPAPRTAEWRVARFVLTDAAYQLFHSNLLPEQFPSIIHLLDQTIADLKALPAATGWK